MSKSLLHPRVDAFGRTGDICRQPVADTRAATQTNQSPSRQLSAISDAADGGVSGRRNRIRGKFTNNTVCLHHVEICAAGNFRHIQLRKKWAGYVENLSLLDQ
ncbi:MAG: hypothetical protein QM656_03005 [Paracoccaceae bacterium]